ncbi:MAG: hypothetical protein LBR33_00825 [Propionibacteriaceae bacterium]|nr:hypothetical protein [Propionibacteriaceae bacterium]
MADQRQRRRIKYLDCFRLPIYNEPERVNHAPECKHPDSDAVNVWFDGKTGFPYWVCLSCGHEARARVVPTRPTGQIVPLGIRSR